jgi:hypothetical protein
MLLKQDPHPNAHQLALMDLPEEDTNAQTK